MRWQASYVVCGIGRLRDYDHTLVLESEFGDGFMGERLGGNDHMGRALHREMAQTQVDTATAQSLAEAGERAELVDGHDHRARAVQHRALHPGRMKHVGVPRAVGLLDLGSPGGRVAQGIEQEAGVASDAARIGGRTAVESDPHERVPHSLRRFTSSPGYARKQHSRFGQACAEMTAGLHTQAARSDF